MTPERVRALAASLYNVEYQGIEKIEWQLRDLIREVHEADAKLCEAKIVDAEQTGNESYFAYNRACLDCAAAIRSQEGKI